MRSVIPYFGGKHAQAPWIISHFRYHKCYLELFGGGGSVLIQKCPSRVEVYNDIDSNLVNFLLVLRSNKERLFEEIDSLPVSRSLYDKWKWEALPEDEFERAVRWWYLARNGYGGVQRHKTGWKHSKVRNGANSYYNACELALSMAERIRNVQIECLDFRECFQIYDSPKTLSYVDPPYRGYEIYYEGNFADNDHVELAKILNAAKGDVIVSYYQDEFIDSLYKNWYKISKSFLKARLYANNKRPQGREVLYLNYEPLKQFRLFSEDVI